MTLRIPWRCVFPEHVALGSWSTELGDVKICLNALWWWLNTITMMEYENSPKRGGHFKVVCSTGLLDHMWSLHTRRPATGHLQPESDHSLAWFACLKLEISWVNWEANKKNTPCCSSPDRQDREGLQSFHDWSPYQIWHCTEYVESGTALLE